MKTPKWRGTGETAGRKAPPYAVYCHSHRENRDATLGNGD